MFLVSLSLPPQLDGGPAAGSAHASVKEIHPADEPIGARNIDDTAAGVLPENKPRGGRPILAVAEGDLDVVHLQGAVPNNDHETIEAPLTPGQNHVVVRREPHHPLAQLLPAGCGNEPRPGRLANTNGEG